jgi:hypothetical protein
MSVPSSAGAGPERLDAPVLDDGTPSPTAAAATATVTIQAVRAKWRGVDLTERAATQSRFIDLCRTVGVPAPT